MSERWSISSTKYGPSVRAGRTTHDGIAAEPDETAAAVAADPAEADGLALPPTSDPGEHAARTPAPAAAPNRARTSRRVRTRPMGRSSSSRIVGIGGTGGSPSGGGFVAGTLPNPTFRYGDGPLRGRNPFESRSIETATVRDRAAQPGRAAQVSGTMDSMTTARRARPRRLGLVGRTSLRVALATTAVV